MDRIESARIFVRVAEIGNLTAVARQLGLTQPTVSRKLAVLEEHLGARLIQRTTRALSLTEDGKIYYEHCRRLLDAADAAETSVGHRAAAPSGLIRIASSVAFGRLHIVPRLPRLLAVYPDIRVELTTADAYDDLVGTGIDLAVRIGELADTVLVARRVGVTDRVTVGAPAYFARAGVPATPQELKKHPCIVHTQLSTGNEWHFTGPGGPVKVRVSGPFLANNSDAIREATLAGLGISVSPAWLFHDAIADGRARVVLPDHAPVALPIQLVHASRRLVSPKVRAVADFLADEFRADPLLAGGGARRASPPR